MDREKMIARHYLETGILGAYETAEVAHEEKDCGKYAPCFEDANATRYCTQTIEPPYTERYVRWCERSGKFI